MYIDKDGGAQGVADNEDDERKYPGTKSKSGIWNYFGFYR